MIGSLLLQNASSDNQKRNVLKAMTMNPTQVKPLLSIVITSYTMDRFKDIRELLDSIKAQSYPNIEVVFVAEGSSELRDNVKAYGEMIGIPNMKTIWNEGERGLSPARNLGILNATGEILGFVVDDVLLAPNWAAEIVDCFEQQDSAIGITGSTVPLWESDSMDWLPQEFYWVIGCTGWYNQDKMVKTRNLWGMNMALRKEAFAAGLFSTSLGLWEGDKVGWNKPPGDENEFSLRVKLQTGKDLLYNPCVVVRHKVRRKSYTTSLIAKEAYRIGFSRAMLRNLYKSGSQVDANLAVERTLLVQTLGRAFPSILAGFFSSPFIAVRRLNFAVIAMSFLAVGYCSYYLRRTFLGTKSKKSDGLVR